MKFQIAGLLMSGLLLVGCQSARVPALLPTVQEYGRNSNYQPASPASQATEPPQLLADASAATPAPESSRRLPAARQLKPIRPANTQVRQPIAAPDTAVVRAAAQTTEPDPETSRVNIMGGVITSAGLITLLAASQSESSSSWNNLFLGLIALALIPVGVALLFYQGKNGRLRLRRQARREARRAAKAPEEGEKTLAATPPVKGNPHMRKVGSILLLISAALLLTGALLGGGYALIFLGLPGIIVGISGLIAVIWSL